MCITVGRLDLKNTIAYFKNWYIKGAASQVKYRNLSISLFVQPKGEGCRCRLIYNPFYFQPCNTPGIFGGLPLAVIKIGGHSDHGFSYFFTEIILCCLSHLLKYHGRYLSGAVILPSDRNTCIPIGCLANLIGKNLDIILYLRWIVLSTNKPLNRKDSVFRVGNGLSLRGLAHQPLSSIGKGNYGRGCSASFCIGDYNRVPALHYSNTRIGCS